MAVQTFLARILSRHELPLAVSKNQRIALIDLNQLSRQLDSRDGRNGLDSLLSSKEQKIYAGFSYPKRRIEWLGGRLAAKYALGQLLAGHALFSYEALSIVPDVHGRPVVNFSSGFPGVVSVSISHSVDYAVAMASVKFNCGIDVQCNSDRLWRVRERFASEAEFVLFAEEQDPLVRLSMLWTVKEAVKKCYLATDSTFFGKIQLTGARKCAENYWQSCCRLAAQGGLETTVHVVLFEQYALAYVLGVNNA